MSEAVVAQFSAPASCPAKRILSIESYRPDGSFDAVVVDLDAAVGQEETQAIPVFGDVFQGFTQGRFGSDAGTR